MGLRAGEGKNNDDGNVDNRAEVFPLFAENRDVCIVGRAYFKFFHFLLAMMKRLREFSQYTSFREENSIHGMAVRAEGAAEAAGGVKTAIFKGRVYNAINYHCIHLVYSIQNISLLFKLNSKFFFIYFNPHPIPRTRTQTQQPPHIPLCSPLCNGNNFNLYALRQIS